MATTYKKRKDFSNDDIYAVYVRNNIAVGQTVMCLRTYEEVKVGDCGKITRLDCGDIRDLNVQVDWQHKGDKYWVQYMHVEIVGVLDAAKLKVGDWVKVKSSVDKPKYDWGNINRHSIGTVTALDHSANAVSVDYPEQNSWKGQLSEIEGVVQIHPGIMCCGCQDLPLRGSRFKCSQCSEFDLCQTCFIHKNVHRHNFCRIICPRGNAVPAGKSDEIIIVGDSVQIKPDVAKPKYGLGNVKKTSIGVLKSISPNGQDVTVDFPEQASWQGILPEICKHIPRKIEAQQQDVPTPLTQQRQPAPVPQRAATPAPEVQRGACASQQAVASQSADDSDSDTDENGQPKDLLWWLNKALEDSIELGAARRRAAHPAGLTNAGVRQVCVLQGICKRFKGCLKLTENYFDPSFDTCFCPVCHERRGDQAYYRRGVPPCNYGVPIGWYKFGLKTPAKAESLNVFKIWHVAFHGTRYDCVKSILDTGDLLMPGDLPPEGDELRPPENHYDPNNPQMVPPAGHDVNKIYLSPSIKYAGCNVYSKPVQFQDGATAKSYVARVAFQVRIKPQSYDVAEQTVGLTSQLDPQIPNSQLEWSTKRRGVTVFTGLLVKIEDLKSPDGVPRTRPDPCKQQ